MALFRRVKPPFSLKTLQKDSNCVLIQDPSQVWGIQDFLPRRNLLLATDTLATQNVTVVATAYKLYMQGTGSITLSGTGSGTLNGTGANDRVSLSFTPTAGTLTLTVSGTVTYGMLCRADVLDQSYQKVTDWTTEQYAWAAAKNVSWLRRNRFLNTATLSTQTVSSVTANPITVSFKGTGTITFSTAYSGSLVGTGANDRVTATFTPSAGNLVCTVTGTVTEAQCEVGSTATDYQPISASWDATYTANAFAAGYPISLWQDSAGTSAVNGDNQAVGACRDLKYSDYEPELVTNGTFTTDTTWWVETETSVMSWESGKVKLVAGAAGNGCRQQLTFIIGKPYLITAWVNPGTCSDIRASILNNALTIRLADSSVITGSAASVSFVWVATETNSHIYIRPGSAGTAYADNVSVREIPGYTAIQTTAANQPKWRLDGNGKAYFEFDRVNDILTPTFSPELTNSTTYLQTRNGTFVSIGLETNDLADQQWCNDVYGIYVFDPQQPSTKADLFIIKDTYKKSLGVNPTANVNDIGTPGAYGFGVGICPSPPAGFVGMPGYTNPLHSNYGNYQYQDGSVMVWIPAFYMRLAHASNPTYGAYGVNSVDVRPLSYFADEGTANSSGYYLHRAFVNAGANQLGFFRDKYDCSLNGTIASSIRNAMPMVSGPSTGQIGFSGCTANSQLPTNTYAGAIPAARSRGSKFFPETIFMADALSRLSDAHAQAASNPEFCAWWSSGSTNFPKGCDNNALTATNDASVKWKTAGASSYPNMPLTGSAGYGGGAGNLFAKSTHNGQNCGVADVAGGVWTVNPGMTCIAASKTITGATQANPVEITCAGHGYATGTVVLVTTVGGMTQINDRMFTITSTGANTFTLDGTNGTGFGAYTSGGSVTTGAFYLLKPAANIETITPGNTLATDHWGATGVAALFDAVTPNFATAYSANGLAQRYGNGTNQVFAWSTAAERALAMAGLPAASGMSVSGASQFGLDYYYQYIRNELCVVSRGNWDAGSTAGSRARNLAASRSSAGSHAGFAASCYL